MDDVLMGGPGMERISEALGLHYRIKQMEQETEHA